MSIISLQATATTIRDVFRDAYVIPQFQRPYVWDKHNCDDLWADISGFRESEGENEQFFLGSIVLYQEDNRWCVIDGQQRLTTLLLLIKALFTRTEENKALEECLWQKDPLTGEIARDQLRVESKVIAKDHENTDEILQSTDPREFSHRKSNLHENYLYLLDQIRDITGSDEFKELILTILDKVVLLPIRCDSRDDALRIFQSINNRGMKLDDSDIFKSEIYGLCKSDNERDNFIKRWNDFNDPMYLFRLYMYIHRADNVAPHVTEKALLSYFSENRFEKLQNYKNVMSDLEKISMAHEWLEVNYPWWHILTTLPNNYWQYPLFVFLRQYGSIDKDGAFSLGSEQDNFDRLIEETAKYSFINGIIYNSVNRIKSAVFEACSCIAKEKDYVEAYQRAARNEMEKFREKVNSGMVPKRYIKGMVLIGAMCNRKQNQNKFFNVIGTKYDIEHILPKQWKDDYYGDWDEEKADHVMDTFGNLMPLERKVNIKAGNNFFGHKKDDYKKSKIQDAIDLSDSSKYPSKNWSYDDYAERHKKMLERFEKFFKY